jgi:hypothetical protein
MNTSPIHIIGAGLAGGDNSSPSSRGYLRMRTRAASVRVRMIIVGRLLWNVSSIGAKGEYLFAAMPSPSPLRGSLYTTKPRLYFN